MKFVRALALLAPAALVAAAGLACPMLAGCSRVEQAPAVVVHLARRTQERARRAARPRRAGELLVHRLRALRRGDAGDGGELAPLLAAGLRDAGRRRCPTTRRRSSPTSRRRARCPSASSSTTPARSRAGFGNVQFTPTSLLINKRGRDRQALGRQDRLRGPCAAHRRARSAELGHAARNWLGAAPAALRIRRLSAVASS